MNTELEQNLNQITDGIRKMDELRHKLHKPMCEAIYDMCEERGGEIDLRAYNELYGSVAISYDGGNHPEYASEAFSEVIKVKPTMLKDWLTDSGKDYKSFEVTLLCYAEEIDGYDEKRMSFDETESVFRQVYSFFQTDPQEFAEMVEAYL